MYFFHHFSYAYYFQVLFLYYTYLIRNRYYILSVQSNTKTNVNTHVICEKEHWHGNYRKLSVHGENFVKTWQVVIQ